MSSATSMAVLCQPKSITIPSAMFAVPLPGCAIPVILTQPSAAIAAAGVITSYSIHYTKLYEAHFSSSLTKTYRERTSGMADVMTAPRLAQQPDHVPDELVYDFDMYHDAALNENAPDRLVDIAANAPPVFWTAHNGGIVITSYSIHYTKLYENGTRQLRHCSLRCRPSERNRDSGDWPGFRQQTLRNNFV